MLLRWQFDYNFYYVICCGFKASDKLRTSFGENVFFSFGGGILFKMQALDYSGFKVQKFKVFT
jgi:uncharacterized membrane protein